MIYILSCGVMWLYISDEPVNVGCAALMNACSVYRLEHGIRWPRIAVSMASGQNSRSCMDK